MNDQRLDRYLAETILELLATARMVDLTEAGSEAILLARINEILDQYGRTLADVVPERIVLDYFGGVDAANKALAAAGAAAAAPAVQRGIIQPMYRRLIHLEAVREIVDDAMNDIAQAIATTRNLSAAAVMQTVDEVRQELASGLIRGDSQNVTTKRLMDRFLKEGLSAFVVEDKNGNLRTLPLHHYTRTVVRSKTRMAQVNGSVNRYKEQQQEFVRIVGNGDSCAFCSQYKDMVVSLGASKDGFPALGGAYSLPPYHPNCRCGVIPFSMADASMEERAAVQKAMDEFEPGKDRRTPEQKAAYEREQAARRVANANLKQYQRWQTALGAEAPKTFGAFQNMKRQNTVRFQELQSEYRSYSMINRKK